MSRPAFYRSKPSSRSLTRAAAWVLLLVLLAGCQSARNPNRPSATASAQAAQTQGANVGTVLQHHDVGGNSTLPLPMDNNPPLRFTLPTPGQNPISLWRPPLYDTPWALGQFDHFYFSRPIAADEVNWPIADYRYGGTFFSSDIVHTGVDIPAPRDTPVIAAGNGRVVWAGYGLYYGNNNPNDPYGLAVTIRHDFGYQGQRLYTVYAHMGEILVTEGQDVKTGDVLGKVGTTGLTTGPHLHFEVRTDRNSYFTTLNPELWLAPPQGWGVLVGRLENTNGSMLTGQDVTVISKENRQRWVVRTYGNQAVNSDTYYQENLVLSDLPAGTYTIDLEYQDKHYQQDIEIHAGAVSYFTFRGKLLFNTSLPPTPSIEDLLPAQEP